MSSTTSQAASSTSSMPMATRSDVSGAAQSSQGTTALALFTAIGAALAIFAAQLGLFELLRNKMTRIYRPKTYLVPERERTRPPPWAPLAWVRSIFTYRDREIIAKCGLDAYFFLRYLQTLLIIFIPLMFVIIPILLPINSLDGQGTNFRNGIDGVRYNVTGLDTLAWGNIKPQHTRRYWAHLLLAILVVVWVCAVFFFELRVYIRVRQDFLTSAEHRLTASATTILVSSIPKKWLTYEALDGLYDVFPGGIRNIWINRNYNPLLEKINLRTKIRGKLESAESELIKKCKKAQTAQSAKDEQRAAKKSGMEKLTKEEKQRRAQNVDMEANRLAQGQGVSAGDRGEVARTVDEAVQDSDAMPREVDPEAGEQTDNQPGGLFKKGMGGGLATIRHGIGKSFNVVGSQFEKAGQTIAGGVRAAGQLDDELDAPPGFVPMERREQPSSAERRPPVPHKNTGYEPEPSGLRILNTDNNDVNRHEPNTRPVQPTTLRREVAFGQSPALSTPGTAHQPYDGAQSEASLHHTPSDATQTQFEEPKLREKDWSSDNWIKFWRGPAVGYPSPNPHGYEELDEFPLESKISQVDGSGSAHRQDKPGKRDRVNASFQGIWSMVSKKPPPDPEYPQAYNDEFADDGVSEPLWKKYIKESDRPRHRLPRFSWTPGFLPSLPLISRSKVDTIYWCRTELARLNVEIREDQEDKDNEERYPLMNSAFIQFNHQVAAHMACQAVSHHIPKQMAPRDVEIAPSDVIWDNMSITWWEAWLRTAIILCIVAGMIILWAIPVSFTALVGNLPNLIQKVPWLGFLNDSAAVRNGIKALSGVLPAVALAILLALVPPIFYALAQAQGAKTLVTQELSVQNYYFFFLFVQVFLVVSISSSVVNTLSASYFTSITSIPRTLAESLPKASNYFFSYMILQAFGNSSGALLQYVTLALWFILPKIIDSTARDKFNRATTLQSINWGTYFPTYTNFACIALIYSVVSPMILVFAVITFSLYWVANRYCMLYIFKLHTDTGGLLYPRAINQTFTGLYVMELCMIGLFFLVRDENDKASCFPQAIIMIVVAGFTVLFQILLNQSFGPLFRHLPITLEDDAVLRDEQFERMELERINRAEQDNENGNTNGFADQDSPVDLGKEQGIPMETLAQSDGAADNRAKYNPLQKGLNSASTWANKRTRAVATMTGADTIRERHRRRQKDLEKQQAELSGTFFSGDDELEDLSPHQREALVKDAFRHSAIRAKQPAVWIPRDDLGVSDDEIRHMELFSSNIWASNQGAGLDSKFRVIFQQNPPDYSEVEHIRL